METETIVTSLLTRYFRQTSGNWLGTYYNSLLNKTCKRFWPIYNPPT